MHDVVILGGARTPMAEYVGDFANVSALELGAHATKAALERTGVDAAEIDHVFFGNALQTSGDAIYGARHVSLKAGIANEVPALTLNRLCGSGIQAIVSAAQTIQLDEAKICVAGGMENMTQAPHVVRGARQGLKLGQGELEDSLMVALLDTHCNLYMAQTAEKLATSHNISREAQDEYALRSQQAAAEAQEKGRFKDEIAPIEVRQGRHTKLVETDDHMRPDTTLEGLAKLRPAFSKEGTVTAGNASGIVDGAAAVIVATADSAAAKGREPLGRIVSWGIAGVDPSIMGIGPVPAIRQALERANRKLDDVTLIEINEAFAAQYLAVEKELGLDRNKVNVNGGAIALGHPLAATGTRIVLSLLHELRRRGGGLGIASACIGGGQGIALVVEAT